MKNLPLTNTQKEKQTNNQKNTYKVYEHLAHNFPTTFKKMFAPAMFDK